MLDGSRNCRRTAARSSSWYRRTTCGRIPLTAYPTGRKVLLSTTENLLVGLPNWRGLPRASTTGICARENSSRLRVPPRPRDEDVVGAWDSPSLVGKEPRLLPTLVLPEISAKDSADFQDGGPSHYVADDLHL